MTDGFESNQQQAEPSLELPALQQTEMSEEQLQAYLFDVQELGHEIKVSYRTELRAHSQVAVLPLDLVSLFRNQGARAARLEYRFQQKMWCDTLMLQGSQVRLVRMEQTMMRASE